MSILGKGILMLGTNSSGLEEGFKKAGASAKAFEAKIKTLPEVGEKMKASFGNIGSVAGTFHTMSSDVSFFEKSVLAANSALAATTVGLQLALKATTGLKAALLGTGIGALIVGAGWLVSRIASSRREADASRPEPDAETDRFMRERERTALTPGVRSREVGAWDWVTAEEARAHRFEVAVEARSRAVRETMLRPVAELGIHAARTADSMERVVTTFGMTADEVTIMDMETRRAAMALDPLIASSTLYRDIVRDIGRARAASSRVTMLTEVARETERTRAPLERVGSELERISRIFRYTRDADVFRRGLEGIVAVPATEFEATRSRIDTVRAAFGALVDESMARTETRGGLLGALFGGLTRTPVGGTFELPDPTTFVRAMEDVAGRTRTPLEALGERIRSIGEAWEAAGEMATMFGDSFDDSVFRRAESTALLDMASSLPTAPTQIGALQRGSSAAISEVNRINSQAEMQDPVERVRLAIERQATIEEAQRRSLEAIERALADGTIVRPGVL
jgi:hypothetical protein